MNKNIDYCLYTKIIGNLCEMGSTEYLLLDPVNYPYHANNLLLEINLESTLAM